MKRVGPVTTFKEWRDQSRRLLDDGVSPGEVLWEGIGEESLFGEAISPVGGGFRGKEVYKVSADFLKLAKEVACHADTQRWTLLYRLLWRMTQGGEKALLEIVSDADVARARLMAKNVRREIHKMHAFVRFRKIGEDESGRERYGAWFEPDHWIVEAGSPFFRDRFSNMDWSIFTPKGCVHWIGGVMEFSPGVEKDPCDSPDELEQIWRTYYRSIFNPARLKPKMMQSEMPKRYWKNLPEADLIPELIRESRSRVSEMHAEPERDTRDLRNAYLNSLREASVPYGDGRPPSDDVSLEELGRMMQACRACPLWERATCAVAGRGPESARMMIVGEQPGDQEDLKGLPFVGPAGQLLDRALAEAGLDRSTAYVTNAVKHFKWESRGKHRLHRNPDRNEIDACRPWLMAELSKVAPEVLILLGATAASSLLGPGVKVMRDRGEVQAPRLAKKVILTVHPSFLLRVWNEAEKAREYERFVGDLRLALQGLD
jgi:probable DNA metabolism protein